MATLQSHGLHEPLALPYLVAEGILAPDPSPESYTWNSLLAPAEDGSGLVQEEILTAGSYVVWSRCGTIKRVFSVGTDEEPIVKAFTTSFAAARDSDSNGNRNPSSTLRGQKALVVLLKSQAHILLVSGDSHILPFAFEVQSAFPCTHGFLLQRKVIEKESGSPEHSFHHDLSTINESRGTVRTNSARPSLLLPNLAQPAVTTRGQNKSMPRTYSFTEVMSELGLVVCGTSSRPTDFDDCPSLPVDEDIVYLSGHDELYDLSTEHAPLCLAVTRSTLTGKISIWHVARDVPPSSPTSSRTKAKSKQSEVSRRKSSNIYGRGIGMVGQPPRGPSKLRESLVGPAPLNAENLLNSSATEHKSSPDDLAAQFGSGFGEAGVQTRSARRVSSMLARTDLGAGNDRGAFHDLAMGHTTRKSLNRPGHRGESIGSFGDRQSFGRRRSSFPATESILSNGTSFLNVPGQLRSSIFDSGHGMEAPDDTEAPEGNSNLPRNIGFFKLSSFSVSDEGLKPVEFAEYEVLILPLPQQSSGQLHIAIGVLDKSAALMAIVTIQIDLANKTTPSHKLRRVEMRLTATKIRRLSGIACACLVRNKSQVRMLTLASTRHGQATLQLEVSPHLPFRIELPETFSLINSLRLFGQADSRRDDQRSQRMIPRDELKLCKIQNYGVTGDVLMIDNSFRRHVVSVALQPVDPFVDDVLRMSNIVFGSPFQDSLLITLWEVMRWLRNRGATNVTEWTALIVVIFTLAVPFLDDKPAKPSTPQKRKKAGLLRSGSGTAVDLSDFQTMRHVHEGSNNRTAWSWLTDAASTATGPIRSPKHSRTSSMQTTFDEREVSREHLLRCIAWAQEFVQSPAGEAAIGPEGHLPTAVSKDREVRQTALAKLLVGTHLINEEHRLNVVSKPGLMIPVLAQLGEWLNWQEWTMSAGNFYAIETNDPDVWTLEDTKLIGLGSPGQPFSPPSIFQYVTDALNGQADEAFPTLEVLIEPSDSVSDVEKKALSTKVTPRTYALLSILKGLEQKHRPKWAWSLMSEQGISQSLISTLPDGIAAVFYQAAATQKATSVFHLGAPNGATATSKLHLPPSHDAVRDYHSMAMTSLETENLQRWDASSEADRLNVTRLIYQDDRRFQEAAKLVNQTRPPVVECNPDPDSTEADLLEAQKELVQFVTRRTLSVASGRGIMHFNARVPLLTERVPIPAFSLQCLMKARSANESTQVVTFSADKASFTEDKVCWAFFHNGASAGLMISRDARGIDTSWILYNKPPELTNRHAGFLLALGLNGHLKTLAKWVAFKYLTPKHTMTSIGLLLGLSASYLGTQDQLITRMLSVHVTRLLPPGSTELNVSPLTQATGIMGIGLLYHNSQHRRMSEVMLSELENNDSEEGASDDLMLRDEGYRLAAGFSLGLINLGQGNRLHGLHDMAVVERLLTIAVGTKNVNLVHILDRATAGAVMAVAFIFLKTNDESIARKVDIPDTVHQFDYVRPDIFLLRTLARHLIMWNSIKPTQDFVTASLPRQYRPRASLHKVKALHTEDMPFYNILTGILFALGLRFAGSQSPLVRDLLVSYLDQFLRLSRLPCDHYDATVTLNGIRNCLDVLALATATVVAGSGDLIVLRRLRSLHGRVDKDTPFGSHMAAHMAIGTLFLGGGTMTFGTSDLAVAGLCIAFYPLFPGDVLDNRTHLQALRHLWTIAVEGRCLVVRSGDTVVGGIDGYVKLRNGQELIVRAPGLLPEFDAISSIAVKGEGYWDVTLDFSSTLLMDRIKSEGAVNVRVTRKPSFDNEATTESLLEALDSHEEVRRMHPNSVPSVDKNVAMRTHGNNASLTGEPFEWLFELETFKSFDYKERDLVLNSLLYLGGGREVLKGTVVDERLVFERGSLPEQVEARRDASDDAKDRDTADGAVHGVVERDKLWQLRLLFEWFDRFDRDDEEGNADVKWGSGLWLKREVVARLRERVWDMASSMSCHQEVSEVAQVIDHV